MTTDAEFEEFIKNAEEIKLYYVIQDLGGLIFNTQRWVAKGNMSPSELVHIPEYRKRQVLATEQLKRFGIEANKNGIPTDQYWEWYHKWRNWDKNLSDEDFRKMDDDMTHGRDLSKWKP